MLGGARAGPDRTPVRVDVHVFPNVVWLRLGLRSLDV